MTPLSKTERMRRWRAKQALGAIAASPSRPGGDPLDAIAEADPEGVPSWAVKLAALRARDAKRAGETSEAKEHFMVNIARMAAGIDPCPHCKHAVVCAHCGTGSGKAAYWRTVKPCPDCREMAHMRAVWVCPTGHVNAIDETGGDDSLSDLDDEIIPDDES